MRGQIIKGNRKSSTRFLVGRWFQALNSLRKKSSHGKPITMQNYVFKIARVTGKSEYDVFCKSAESWPINHERIEQDFRAYLAHQSIPYYVADFVRKNKKHIDELHIPLF